MTNPHWDVAVRRSFHVRSRAHISQQAVVQGPVRRNVTQGEKVKDLFQTFDVDSDGSLDVDEYRSFLQGIGVWNKSKITNPNYQDYNWALLGFEKELTFIGSIPARGADWVAFQRLYAEVRKAELVPDYAKFLQVQRSAVHLFFSRRLTSRQRVSKIRAARCAEAYSGRASRQGLLRWMPRGSADCGEGMHAWLYASKCSTPQI